MLSKALRSAIKPLRLGRMAMMTWDALPERVVSSRPMINVGHVIYDHFTRHSGRIQSHTTLFLRNRPQLEVLRDLAVDMRTETALEVTSLGCSSGAELYSLLYVMRSAHSGLPIRATGMDIDDSITEIARRGIYDPSLSSGVDGLVPPPGIDDVRQYLDTLGVLLERTDDGMLRVKDWVRAGTAWGVGDATSPTLADQLGPQDIVLANNFLGPMDDALAEKCIRNIVRVAKDGGLLVLDGVDRDLKSRLLPQLGLEPITERLAEIYHADPTKADWPWTRWSHEPLDLKRPDWGFRYSAIFRKA